VFTASINALMMEAVSTSETSVNFYDTSRRNPEDGHLRNEVYRTTRHSPGENEEHHEKTSK
jgi:hypothetical protein